MSEPVPIDHGTINNLDAIEALPFEMLSGPEAGEQIRDSLIAEIRWLRSDLDAERDARIAAEAESLAAETALRVAAKGIDGLRVNLLNAETERDDALARAVPEGVVMLDGQRYVVECVLWSMTGPDEPHPDHFHRFVPDPQPVPVAPEERT